jgi:hypothetical protein
LDVIVIIAVRFPSALGENVTVIVHLVPGEMLPAHVLVALKSPLLETATLVVRTAVPELVTVTASVLLFPICWLPNVILARSIPI